MTSFFRTFSFRTSFVLFIGVIAVMVLFRTSFLTHFTLVSGDNTYDQIIDTSIFEHWFNVFSGKENWRTVGYFFPYVDTLGYNDGYFLYGVIYSIFRYFHADPFLSRELLLCCLALIGYLSFYALARYLNYSVFLSVIGALIFLYANNLQLHILHSQLATLFFAPFVWLFVLKWLQALKDNQTRLAIANGAVVAVSFSLWLLTTYYMAWFAVFFLTIFAGLWWCFHREEAKQYFKPLPLIVTAGLFLLSLCPFFLVYLPTLLETGGHSFNETLYYAPSFSALLNVGPQNIFFGYLYTKLLAHVSIRHDYEFMIGYSYLFILLVVIAIISNIKNKRNLALSIAIVLAVLFMLKIHEHSLWKIVYYLFPGAKGLRVVARFAIFLNFPMTILLLDFFARIRVKSKAIVVTLACLTVASNVNSITTLANRANKLDIYNSMPPIPKACRAFFVFPRHYPDTAGDTGLSLYDHNVDAMFLSEKYGIRTINGFSTFNPPTWDLAAYPQDSYKQRVLKYLRVNKIDPTSNICALDLATNQWNTHPFSMQSH